MDSSHLKSVNSGSPMKAHKLTNSSDLIVSVSMHSPSPVLDDTSLAELGLQVTHSRCEVCRICLEESGRLISPCHCRGSVQYVHENCLREWISKTMGAEAKWHTSTSAEVTCQMCKSPITFSVRRKYKCRKNSFKEVFAKAARNIIVKIAVLVFLLGSACFLSVVSSQSFNANARNSFLSVNLGLAIASLVMVAVIMALFIWLLVLFVRQYIVRIQVDIYNIGECKNHSPQFCESSPRARKIEPVQIVEVGSPVRTRTTNQLEL